MSAQEFIDALQDARDSLPGDGDAEAKLEEELGDLQARAYAIEFVNDLEQREDVAQAELLDQYHKDGVNVIDVTIGFPDGAAVSAVRTNGTSPSTDGSEQLALEEVEEPAADEEADVAGEDDPDEDVQEDEDAESKKWCGRCGDDFDTERGLKIHNGRTHDGDAIILDEEPSEEDLVDGDESDSDGGNRDGPDFEDAESCIEEVDDTSGLVTTEDIPEEEQAYVLEWGRWGPPHGGTYHVDEDCPALHRDDSDRDTKPLPWSRDELAESDDWDACGRCSNEPSDDADGEDEDVEDVSDSEEPAEEPDTSDAEEEEETQISWRSADEFEDRSADATQGGGESEVPEASEDSGEYPRQCGGDCDFKSEDSVEWAVHRTEDHDTPHARLDSLEQGEFAALVEDADSVGDLKDELGWSTGRILNLLGVYGLADVVAGEAGDLSNVDNVEFDGFVDDGDESESPLASEESEHKYDTGDSQVTDPDLDEDDDQTDVEDTSTVLDDLDVDPKPGMTDEAMREAAHRVGNFQEFAAEVGLPNGAIARLVADRLDVHTEVQRAPTDAAGDDESSNQSSGDSTGGVAT